MARTYTVDAKRYNFINVDSNLVTSYLVTEADHNKTPSDLFDHMSTFTTSSISQIQQHHDSKKM